MCKRTAIAVLLVLVLILVTACGGPEGTYKSAQDLLAKGKYTEAAEKLESLGSYEDAAVLAMYCKACALCEAGNYDAGIAALEALGDFKDCAERIVNYTALAGPGYTYKKAQALLSQSKYAEAAGKFESLGGYEDSTMLAMYCKACALAESGHYETAISSLKSLGNVKDCEMRITYYSARAKEDEGGDSRWELMLEAKAIYGTIPLFLDGAERIAALDERIAAAQGAQYKAAVEAGEGGDYAAAQAGFRRLGDYSDSASRITYYDIRKAEGALADSVDQDALLGVSAQYAAMGEYLDCADRAAALTDRAETAVEARYAQATALLNEGKPAEAEAVLDAFGQYGSEKVTENYYAIAEKYLASGEYDAASAAFTKAGDYSDASSRINEPFYKQAENLMANGKWDEASAAFVKAADYNDASARILEPYYKKAESLMNEGKWDEAHAAFIDLGDYRDAADRILEPFRKQGEVLMAESKWDEAIAAFEKVANYGKEAYEQYEAFLRESKWDEAEVAYEKITYVYEMIEKYDMRNRRAYCLLRKEEDALADTADQDALVALAAKYTGMGEYLDCAERAAALTDRADAAVEARCAEVTALINEGKYAEAEALLKAFGKYGSEKTAENYYALGEKHLAPGALDKAMSYYEQAGNHADAAEKIELIKAYNAAAALEQAGDYTAARKAFKALGDFADADERHESCCAADYEKVLQLLDKNQVAAAHTLLIDLGAYGDSAAQAVKIEADYQAAGDLLAAGKYGEAAQAYAQLHDYADSQAQMKLALCRQGEEWLAEGKYDEAMAQFEALGETARVKAAKDAKHAYLCGLAEAELTAGNYAEAIRQFEALGETARVKAAKEAQNADRVRRGDEALTQQDFALSLSYYEMVPLTEEVKAKVYTLAQSAYEEGSYEQATKAYELLGQYELSVSRLPVARYAWADQLFNSGSYLEAAEQFKLLGSFTDSADRAKKSTYEHGSQLLNAGSFDESKAVFASLGSYEDAAAMCKECDYQKASALMEKGDLVAAGNLFDSLVSYKDSADQQKECIYLRAEAHLETGDYAAAQTQYKALNGYKDSAEKYQLCTYQMAQSFFRQGKLSEARVLFESIETYEDSAEMVKECRLQKAILLQQQGDYAKALALLEGIEYGSSAQVSAQCHTALGKAALAKGQAEEAVRQYAQATLLPEAQEMLYTIGKDFAATNQMEKAIETLYYAGDYEPARSYLAEIAQALDAIGEKALACVARVAGDNLTDSDLDKVLNNVSCEDFIQAASKLTIWQNADTFYNPILYSYGLVVMDKGEYGDAYNAFIALNGHRDSAAKANDILKAHPEVQYLMASVGSYVTFGTYEQDANTANGKEAIEWQVLVKENNRLLVISRYGLDCQPYNTRDTNVTWETCSLRKWLNNDFFKAAFNSVEQEIIPTVTVSADKNPAYSTNPGNATQDKVFLLSIPEVNKYFAYDSAMKCKPTAYARKQGVWTNDSGFCWWLLRSPGYDQYYAAIVSTHGGVSEYGHFVLYDDGAVRPALWINLEP